MDYTPIKFYSTENRANYLKESYGKILGELAVNTLISEGFLTAPASTVFHGNYEGGLFDHSVNVAEILWRLTQDLNLTWKEGSPERSPLTVGIAHDLCKIDQYKKDETNLENFVYSNMPVIKGHGMKSIIYASKMGIRLSDEERACIAYHMGAFVPKEEWHDYTHAVSVYPNVLWTHTADMIASHIMNT